MFLKNQEGVIKRLLESLQNPEFCDIKIMTNDGEMQANKSILCISSEYFRNLISPNNNCVDHKANTIQVPFSKAILEKLIIYLYSGELDCEDLDLKHLLELQYVLRDVMNLQSEFLKVESFTASKIKNGSFSFKDCFKNFEYCLLNRLSEADNVLASYLSSNFPVISELDEIGLLSTTIIIYLLSHNATDPNLTIFRFRTLVRWLQNKTIDEETFIIEDKTLDMEAEDVHDNVFFNFNHFTIEELATEVKDSELYHTDQIIDRMAQLYETKQVELNKMKADMKSKD